MAAEVETAATAVVAASGGEGEGGQKVPHRLERQWTFWFDNQSKPKQGAAWGTSLRKVYTFDTVEEFWCYRFLDIPEPIRGKIVEAITDAVRKSLEEVATEIQILSLDKNPTTPEKLKRLTAEVEAAERLGFDVKEYKERLAELESVLDVWKEKMDRLAKVRCWMLYARAVRREADEEKDRKAL